MAARAAHVRALEADDAHALGAAAATFEDLGMVLHAAEACFSAAAALRRRRDPRTAARWANRGASLAARCQGARTPGLVASATPVPLSTREREVAVLAADGLGSKEIADRLFISVRTVDNHLGHAYDKLGINGRDELTEALDPV